MVVYEKLMRNNIIDLKKDLQEIQNRLTVLRANNKLENTDLIYFLNLKMLIETLQHYERYMLEVLFKLIN